MLQAGISEIKITPPVGAPLLGPMRPGTGVHDDLFARTLVLDDGERSIAVICLDLVGLDFSTVDELRTKVQKAAGITATLINCSHTHSSPFTIPWSVLGWRWFRNEGSKWRNELIAGVTETVCRAAANLREVELRVGRAPVQIGFNRRMLTDHGVEMRPNPQGAVVPWVDVLRVDAIDDEQPMAVLFSHATHPVIVHGASTLVSADYPGYATEAVRRHFGGKTMAMFAQACGANINGEPLRGGFEAAKRAGVKLAQATIEAALKSEPVNASRLRITSTTVALPFQDLPDTTECQRVLAETENRLAQMVKEEASDEQLWGMRDRTLCLRDLLEKCNRGGQRELRFEVTSLALGDEWRFLAMSHEVFAEYQLWADEALPVKRSMVLAYTNGCESYIPTDADFALGGYEADSFPAAGTAAVAYHHRLALKPGIENRIKETIRSLLEQE